MFKLIGSVNNINIHPVPHPALGIRALKAESPSVRHHTQTFHHLSRVQGRGYPARVRVPAPLPGRRFRALRHVQGNLFDIIMIRSDAPLCNFFSIRC